MTFMKYYFVTFYNKNWEKMQLYFQAFDEEDVYEKALESIKEFKTLAGYKVESIEED